jgi:hypothetical protein
LQRFEARLREEVLLALLSGFFVVVGVVLTAVGLYGRVDLGGRAADV